MSYDRVPPPLLFLFILHGEMRLKAGAVQILLSHSEFSSELDSTPSTLLVFLPEIHSPKTVASQHEAMSLPGKAQHLEISL